MSAIQIDLNKIYQAAYEEVSKSTLFISSIFNGFLITQGNDNSPVNLIQDRNLTDNVYAKVIQSIGLETAYWYALARRITAFDFNASEPLNSFMICLSVSGQNYSIIKGLDKNTPYRLKLGKKLDFYTLLQNKIIRVKVQTGYQDFSVDELGLIDVQSIYQKRMAIDDVLKKQFHTMLIFLWENDPDFQSLIREHSLEELIQIGQSKEVIIDYWNRGFIPGDLYYIILDKIEGAIRQEVKTEKEDNELMKAIVALSTSLREFYSQAQQIAIQKGMYQFPFKPINEFVLLPTNK